MELGRRRTRPYPAKVFSTLAAVYTSRVYLIGTRTPSNKALSRKGFQHSRCRVYQPCIPDWGVDTGVMIRATGIASQGFQVLVDHREGGNIGSFCGNGIGGFNSRQFGFTAKKDSTGKVVGMTPVAFQDLSPRPDPGKARQVGRLGPKPFSRRGGLVAGTKSASGAKGACRRS